MMGNPNAKVKLVEIGSLSCPHCKAFEDEGVPTLIDKYVKSGQVSWEFRPYVIHGPIDMAADLIVRCNGLKTFFPLAQALYKDQAIWMAKIEATPQDKLEQIQNLPTNQMFVADGEPAGAAGLGRGARRAAGQEQPVPERPEDDRPARSRSPATSTTSIPDFTGTPSFVINGKLLKDTASWDKLAAAAGRGAEVMRSRRACRSRLSRSVAAPAAQRRAKAGAGARLEQHGRSDARRRVPDGQSGGAR